MRIIVLVLAIMFITVSVCAEGMVKGGGFYYVNNLVVGRYGQIYMPVHYLEKENGYYQDEGNTRFWVDEVHYELLNLLTQREFIKWDKEISRIYYTSFCPDYCPVCNTDLNEDCGQWDEDVGAMKCNKCGSYYKLLWGGEFLELIGELEWKIKELEVRLEEAGECIKALNEAVVSYHGINSPSYR